MAKRRDSDEAAASRRAAASADYESALLAGDADRAAKASDSLREANANYANRLVDRVRSERRALPDFEALLSDPTFPADPESLVLASIVAYAAAEPATVSVPSRRAAFGMSKWFESSIRESATVRTYQRSTAQPVTSGR